MRGAVRFRRGVRRRLGDDERAGGNVIGVDFVRRRVLPPEEAATGAAVARERHLRVVRVPGERRR